MSRSSVALIVVVALLLRLDGIGFGLDFDDPSRAVLNAQMDEHTMAETIRDRFLVGSLHPGVFLNWGAGAFHLFGWGDVAVLAAKAALAGTSLERERQALVENPSLLHLVHRLISALAGTLTVFLLWRTGRREFGPAVGLAAAALLAAAYLHVRESHFGTLDVLLGLAAFLVFDAALRIARAPGPGGHLRAGAALGLAAAFKLSGAVLVLPVLVGHLLGRKNGARFAHLVAAGASSLLVFVALNPQLVFAFEEQRAVLDHNARLAGLRLEDLPRVLAFHLRVTFGLGLGLVPLLAAGVGAVLATWRRRADVPLLVLACLPVLLVSHQEATRYGVPLVAPLSLLAALGLVGVAGAFAERAARQRAPLAVLLVALALLPSLARSVAFDRLVARRDTRLDVIEHLERAGAGPKDVLAVGFYGLPRRVHGDHAVLWRDALMLVQNKLKTVEQLLEPRPRFILRDRSSGLPEEFVWSGPIAAVAAREYRVVLEVDGRKDGSTPALPDLSSGSPYHLVPFAEPWRMERPGPALVLYERVAP